MFKLVLMYQGEIATGSTDGKGKPVGRAVRESPGERGVIGHQSFADSPSSPRGCGDGGPG